MKKQGKRKIVVEKPNVIMKIDMGPFRPKSFACIARLKDKYAQH